MNNLGSAHWKTSILVFDAVNATRPSLSVIRLCAWLALTAVWAGGVSVAEASRWATLEAIHYLENPRNSPLPGRHGELGAYQFRASTWKMHTKEPFDRALDRRVADQVAVKHYEWLKRGLERAGLKATPYNIALAWNGGLTAAITRRSPRVAHDYASRVSNVVGTLVTRSQTVVAAD